MPALAISIGLILVVAGLVGYFGAGRVSLTALIPTVFGLILAGLGLLAAWQPGARRPALYAAAVVALLGLLGSIQGIPEFFRLLGGADVERPWAATVQTIMVVLTAIFLVAGVRAFILDRRSRA